MSGRYPCKPDAGLTEADYGATLGEIGRALGISKERVRQIEAEALAKARKILERWGFTLQDLLPDEACHDEFLQDLLPDGGQAAPEDSPGRITLSSRRDFPDSP